ncbi:MAG: CHAP domain-containing protein [Bifidobacteriaceae bacterium]|nr:CHAP domain-containing protein [Bifidobacteriaceae bacterium]
MKQMRRSRIAVALCVTAAMCTPLAMLAPAPGAYAISQSQVNQAQSAVTSSQDQEAQLRAQLSGVQSDLADKIVQLDDLTNVQIPAAQDKVTQANSDAATAQQEADSAANRLAAAQKDAEELQKQIEQTGADYDDAKASVAQSARESMHGSSTSDLMSVVTNSTTTTDFINSMQSRDALSRTEANAASEAADQLSTSQNRSERLAAIEQEITQLKADADQKAAAAQQAAAQAQAERDALDQLRAQGESERASLETQVASLQNQAAQQAAQTVLLQSQLDSYNRQYAAQQAAAAAQVNSGVQGTTKPASNAGTSTRTNTNTNTNNNSSSSSSSSNSSGQGTHNGDSGNAYAAGNCTWWAYERRRQMGIGTPSYLGNGGQWYLTAPSYGLRVDHTPQVGAALSFLPGQAGADATYGHVAVVESVNGSTVVISEMNARGLGVVSSRTLTNAGIYWYVH